MRLMEASRTATNDKPTIIPIKMTDCSESEIEKNQKNYKILTKSKKKKVVVILVVVC